MRDACSATDAKRRSPSDEVSNLATWMLGLDPPRGDPPSPCMRAARSEMRYDMRWQSHASSRRLITTE